MRAISTFRYAEESTSDPANCSSNLSRELRRGAEGDGGQANGWTEQTERDNLFGRSRRSELARR